MENRDSKDIRVEIEFSHRYADLDCCGPTKTKHSILSSWFRRIRGKFLNMFGRSVQTTGAFQIIKDPKPTALCGHTNEIWEEFAKNKYKEYVELERPSCESK